MGNDLLYKVAYDEAVRALSEQQAVIESFRTRAGLLFSSAAIAASFLGSQALRGGDPSLASWLALLCFVAVAAASLAILWPRRWEGKANPRDLIETYIESEQPTPIEDLHRDLSLHMSDSYLENRRSRSVRNLASGCERLVNPRGCPLDDCSCHRALGLSHDAAVEINRPPAGTPEPDAGRSRAHLRTSGGTTDASPIATLDPKSAIKASLLAGELGRGVTRQEDAPPRRPFKRLQVSLRRRRRGTRGESRPHRLTATNR
jgi:hypothetical protein